MINESRIKLMTRLAAYEGGEGKKSMAIGTYFKGDYIAKEVMKSIVFATIVYCIVIGSYIVYDFEKLVKDIYDMDLLQLGKTLLKRYLIFTGGYVFITYVVYLVRYRKARHSLRIYYNNLRRLNAMYKKSKEM